MGIALIDIYQEFQFELLEKLAANSSHEFTFAIVGDDYLCHGDLNKIKQIQNKIFNNTELVNHSFFLDKTKFSNAPIKKWLVTYDSLEAIKHIETTFYTLTDRSTAIPIPSSERRLYYLTLVNYFLNVIEDNDIKIGFTFDTPHSYYSHLFYELLKYSNIPVLKIEYHFIPDHALLIANDNLPKTPTEFLKGLTQSELIERMDASLKNNLSNGNKYFENYKAKEQLKSNSIPPLKLALTYSKKIGLNILAGLYETLKAKELRHFTSLNGIKSGSKYRRVANKKVRKLYRLRKYYNSISTTPSSSDKFIYLGLHMQPEKSSLPIGGDYENQLLIAGTIAASLPEDMLLYVKEHPNQYNPKKLANANFRSEEFYNAITKLPNTKLIKLGYSSDELIRRASIVATVSGSIGWEALTLNIPVLTFGQSYYYGCQACSYVTNIADCKSAILNLISLTKEEIYESLLKYLIYYHEEGLLINGSSWEAIINLEESNRDQKLENMVNQIGAKLNQLYPTS